MKQHKLDIQDFFDNGKYKYSYYECEKCSNQIWFNLKSYLDHKGRYTALPADVVLDKFSKTNLNNIKEVPHRNMFDDLDPNNEKIPSEVLFANDNDVYLFRYKHKKDIFRKFPCRWTDEEWLAKQIIE